MASTSFPGSGHVLTEFTTDNGPGHSQYHASSQLKKVEAHKRTISDVLAKYEAYIERGDYPAHVHNVFSQEKGEIESLLDRNDIKNAVDAIISLYEFLDEHKAVDPRIHYPGPGQSFKTLSEKFE